MNATLSVDLKPHFPSIIVNDHNGDNITVDIPQRWEGNKRVIEESIITDLLSAAFRIHAFKGGTREEFYEYAKEII